MSGEDFLRPVEALYEAYAAKAKQLERDKKLGDGWLGLKPGPKDDPCHGQFARDLEELLGQMLARGLTSAQARETVAYILRAPQAYPSPQTVYWMCQAVQGLTIPLAALLAPEDARPLRDEYAKQYRRWERLPAQQKALDALNRACKN